MKFEEQDAKEEAWIKELSNLCRKSGSGPNKGKEVSFPHADGHARYMVFSPGVLLHLAIGDAWHYPHIERLTSKDIVTRIKSQEGMNAIFGCAPAS